MTWAKFDDNFPDSLKVERLSDRAFRAHVRAICHAARTRSDGYVMRTVAAHWGGRTTAECMAAGVWHAGDDLCHRCEASLQAKAGGLAPRPECVYVHDYLDFNPSRAEIDAERAASRERQRRWRDGVTNAVSNAVTNGEVTSAVSSPAPTRPDVPTEHNARARARPLAGRFEDRTPTPMPPRFTGRCEECGFAVDHDETCSKAAT